MQICPQCQCENPDDNKYCQQCGTSLDHLICPSCGAENPVAQLTCNQCDSVIGTVLQALTVPPQADAVWPHTEEDDDDAGINSDSPFARYLPLAPFQEIDSSAQYETHVLDRQPYRLRFFDRWLHQPLEGDAEPTLPPSTQPSNNELAIESQIPPIAQPYLLLDSQLGQRLPQVYDTWQSDGWQVLLIEDRSDWKSLTDLWCDPDTPTLQVLHDLYEMLDLWEELIPVQCTASLLVLDNLCVDEDSVLSLKRLHDPNASPEPPTAASSLTHLGEAWLKLLTQADHPGADTLINLAQSIARGQFTSPDIVRQHLRLIADSLEQKNPIPAAILAEAAPVSAPSANPANPLASVPLNNLRDDDDADDTPTIVLPMKLSTLDEAGRTDIGRQRDHNEDYFGIYTNLHKRETPTGKTVRAHNLYVLCDGMGGHASGEVASHLAVKTLHEYFQTHWQEEMPSAESIREGILMTNQVIYDANQSEQRSGSARMGTTLVLVLIHNSKLAVAHVGDSRLYRLTRRRGLEQITTDHEVGQREIQRGIDPEAAYSRPDAYQLTQALGPRDNNGVDPDVEFFELDEDALLLLCSDGLSDNDLIETHWQTHLAPLISSRANLDQGVSQLVDLANQHNGHDNITALLIRAKVQPNMDGIQ
ncbi:MAG TPA: serine/threonine phosphatase [Coleofasciculaceae cyanobacterium]